MATVQNSVPPSTLLIRAQDDLVLVFRKIQWANIAIL